MNLIRTTWAAAVFALAAAVVPASAALSEGDPAPNLGISKWVQGEPVSKFEPGKVYVVEFWATWCPPCRESIPHLNALHQKFKDKGLVVIGVDSGEPAAKVIPFVKQMGDRMTYRVGADTIDEKTSPDGKTVHDWMAAADINTIPTAFVVDKKGTIVFIGQPMELNDEIIQGVLDGTFDAKQAVALHKKIIEEQEHLKKLSLQLDASIQDKQWDKADATLDEIDKLVSADRKPAAGFMRLRVLLNRGDSKGASKLATDLSAQYSTNAALLNALGSALISEKGVTDRDIPLAEKLISKANDLTEGKNPQVLDTYARVLFLAGKKDQAVESETKAAALVDGEAKEMLDKRVASYKSGKLPPIDSQE